MQNWSEIIKESEKIGLITPQEAESLTESYEYFKTAGLGKLFTSGAKKLNEKMITFGATDAGAIVKRFVRNPGAIIGLALLTEAGSGAAQSITKPLFSAVNYISMKKELQEIAPEIVAKYPDEHIKRIYGSVSQLTPAMAGNAHMQAILVRDNIQVPGQMNYQQLQALTSIQKNLATGASKGETVGRKMLGSATSASISETAKAFGRSLVKDTVQEGTAV